MLFVENMNCKEVVKNYPEAEKIVKVEGGYMVFETVTEYETWKNQK